MTIKDLAAVMAEDTTFTILIGPDQEVVIGKEDTVVMEALGNVLIDHVMVNNANRLCGLEEGGSMRLYRGCWYYQGRKYPSLRGALLAAWHR